VARRPPRHLALGRPRRADALVALASASSAQDHDPDRATVVVHAELGSLVSQSANAELERGPVIHPATALRLACDCRLQAVLEDRADHALGIGRTSPVVPRWLARQLLKRDRGCTFPGCGATAFLHAHHIVHWLRGGPTELDNLTLLCSYHHKLVHESAGGWCSRTTEPPSGTGPREPSTTPSGREEAELHPTGRSPEHRWPPGRSMRAVTAGVGGALVEEASSHCLEIVLLKAGRTEVSSYVDGLEDCEQFGPSRSLLVSQDLLDLWALIFFS
jgi:hypothetical protein